MSTAHTLLPELIEPLGGCLTVEVAERWSALRAPASVQTRIEALAQKSEEGQLSGPEQGECEALVSAENFSANLPSKARRALQDRPV